MTATVNAQAFTAMSRKNHGAAFRAAAAAGEVAEIKVLQQHLKPGEINDVDSRGNTALMLAGETGLLDAVYVIASIPGVNFDLVNKNGKTAADIILANSYAPHPVTGHRTLDQNITELLGDDDSPKRVVVKGPMPLLPDRGIRR